METGRRTQFIPIGICDQADTDRLTKIDQSIEALTAYIREFFPDVILPLENERKGGSWSLKAVTKVLDAGLKAALPSDAIIVYWAGHGESGMGSHRLLLHDEYLMTRSLAGWLLDCPARDVVCIIDCCWSGDGSDDLIAEAQEITRQQGLAEYDHQTTTLIVSARSEPAQEGAFVAAMIEVLTNGPGRTVTPNHSWSQQSTDVSPSELLEAIRVHMRETGTPQQPFQRSLRPNDLGRFFPSIWHAKANDPKREVDPRSRARLEAERSFSEYGVPPPSVWTESELNTHLVLMQNGNGLPEDVAGHLSSVLETILLAISAEALAHTLIEGTHCFTDHALRSARRAASQWHNDSPVGRQFDLFHDASTRRGAAYPIAPEEALLRFVGKLAFECGKDPYREATYYWAEAHGFESNEVNRILDLVKKHSPLRRLVINLNEGNRLVSGEFPRFAYSQLYEDELPVGERYSVDISTPTNAEVCLAIAHLLNRHSVSDIQSIDVVVPDQLMLLDPSSVLVERPRRGPTTVGSTRPVSLRVGGRFHPDTDWQRMVDMYLTLTRTKDCFRWVEGEERGSDCGENFWDDPGAIAFRRTPAQPDQLPPPVLLDAVYASPIVIWPAEQVHPQRLQEAIETCWPDMPDPVWQARWFGSESGRPHVELLGHLRMVWEDDGWLNLASQWERYG